MRFIIVILSLMAVNCKKNQPIIFQDSFANDCGTSSYCVPVEQADTTQIQFELTEYETTNLISNGTFASGSGWTVGSDWSIASGEASASVTVGTSDLERTVDDTLVEGYYLVQFDISGVADNLIMSVILGGNVMSTVIGDPQEQTIKLFQKLDTFTDNLLVFSVSQGDVSIDNVIVKRHSRVGFNIRDCDTEDVFYSEDDEGSVTYYESEASYTFNQSTGLDYSLQDIEGAAVLELNWDTFGLEDGCYCLCIKDLAETTDSLINNGDFDTGASWTITNSGGGGWAISAGKAQHTDAPGAGTDVIEQTLSTPLSADCKYHLTFDMESSNTAESLTVLYDTALLTNQTLQVIPLDGDDSYDIEIDNIAVTKIKFRLPDFTDSAGVTLDNVAITKDFDCVECTCETECISLRESHDGTVLSAVNMLIEATCDDDAFGYLFDTLSFSLKGRIFGRIRNSKYPEIENYQVKSSAGTISQAYAEIEKIKELQIYEVPEGVHDWLSMALLCDTVNITVNGETKQFVKQPGEYLPNWRRTSRLAPVIVEIKEVQQLKPNTYS